MAIVLHFVIEVIFMIFFFLHFGDPGCDISCLLPLEIFWNIGWFFF